MALLGSFTGGRSYPRAELDSRYSLGCYLYFSLQGVASVAASRANPPTQQTFLIVRCWSASPNRLADLHWSEAGIGPSRHAASPLIHRTSWLAAPIYPRSFTRCRLGIPAKPNAESGRKPNGIPGSFRTPSERSHALRWKDTANGGSGKRAVVFVPPRLK